MEKPRDINNKKNSQVANYHLFYGVSNFLSFIKKFIPRKLFRSLQPYYHLSLAFIGALIYGFPSKKIKVVAITGTKGKTTSTEIVSSLLEASGYKVASLSTLQIKIGENKERNLFKMTTPGRLFLQKFLHQAVKAGCDYVVLESSSEAAKLNRQAFIDLDALIFTNLSPEHIESHGSYEKYVKAKLSIARALAKSSKKNTLMVINGDDAEAEKFLAIAGPKKISYSLKNAEPYTLNENGSTFTFAKKEISTSLPGVFNIYNILGAAMYALSQGVSAEQIKTGVENLTGVLGRMQKVYSSKYKDKQNFDVIVDYAHTAESLKSAYGVYAGKKRMICILGNCGGGRDKWKRPAMGKIAGEMCDEIILTNEDPYDEDPNQIICEVAGGINKKHDVIIDRREAIKEAIKRAKKGDVVMITGKGTDPFIMEAGGKKTPWSDAQVAKEELDSLLASR